MFKLCPQVQWLPWIIEQIEFEFVLINKAKWYLHQLSVKRTEEVFYIHKLAIEDNAYVFTFIISRLIIYYFYYYV